MQTSTSTSSCRRHRSHFHKEFLLLFHLWISDGRTLVSQLVKFVVLIFDANFMNDPFRACGTYKAVTGSTALYGIVGAYHACAPEYAQVAFIAFIVL